MPKWFPICIPCVRPQIKRANPICWTTHPLCLQSVHIEDDTHHRGPYRTVCRRRRKCIWEHVFRKYSTVARCESIVPHRGSIPRRETSICWLVRRRAYSIWIWTNCTMRPSIKCIRDERPGCMWSRTCSWAYPARVRNCIDTICWHCIRNKTIDSRCIWIRFRRNWFRANSHWLPKYPTRKAARNAASREIRTTATSICVARCRRAYFWCNGTIRWTSLCCWSNATGHHWLHWLASIQL